MINTPMPINPVVNQTSAATNIMTPITICCNGIAACNLSIPLPTTRISGIAIIPAATVTAINLMKSAVGSAEDQVSIGNIIFNANVAPDLDLPIMYKNPRTITVTAVLTADKIAITSNHRDICNNEAEIISIKIEATTYLQNQVSLVFSIFGNI